MVPFLPLSAAACCGIVEPHAHGVELKVDASPSSAAPCAPGRSVSSRSPPGAARKRIFSPSTCDNAALALLLVLFSEQLRQPFHPPPSAPSGQFSLHLLCRGPYQTALLPSPRPSAAGKDRLRLPALHPLRRQSILYIVCSDARRMASRLRRSARLRGREGSSCKTEKKGGCSSSSRAAF